MRPSVVSMRLSAYSKSQSSRHGSEIQQEASIKNSLLTERLDSIAHDNQSQS